MASTIVIPSAASIGACAAEVATNLKAAGDPDARVANALIDVATAASTDITALQAGTSSTGINGATVPAGGALTTGNVLQVAGAAALSYGAVNLAGGANYVTGVLPAANASREAGLEHSVRGIVTANVANLAAFTVAGNDGLTYAAGERVGLVGQTTDRDCGPYVVGTVGGGTAPLTRAADWAASAVLPPGSSIRANEGTIWAGHVWYATVAGSITVGGTAPDFYPRQQSGTTAAMSTGVTVSNVWLKSTAQSLSPITTQINTVGGAPTFSSVPIASRTAGHGNGSFVITGDAGDTSTMDWIINN